MKIKKLSEDELKKLWEQHEKTRAKIVRDELIIQYIYLVKYVVGRLRINLPGSISTDDIAGYGVEGLIDAIERFTSDKGSRFETYALMRIRGTIIDKIRSQDWIPRGTRKRIKDVKNSIEKLRNELGRKPTAQEIAQDLDTTKEKIDAIMTEMDSNNIISIYENKGSSDDGGIEIIDTIQDTKAVDPSAQLEEKDVKKELSMALKRLPERERMILTLYYHENMTLKEIGEAINISESRVCQLHAQAIMKLRNLLSSNKMSLRKSIV